MKDQHLCHLRGAALAQVDAQSLTPRRHMPGPRNTSLRPRAWEQCPGGPQGRQSPCLRRLPGKLLPQWGIRYSNSPLSAYGRPARPWSKTADEASSRNYSPIPGALEPVVAMTWASCGQPCGRKSEGFRGAVRGRRGLGYKKGPRAGNDRLALTILALLRSPAPPAGFGPSRPGPPG